GRRSNDRLMPVISARAATARSIAGNFRSQPNMPRIELVTHIAGPCERCFDLARSVEVHIRSTASTGERAIAGRTSGLMELGDEVTWQARHFGFQQTLTSRITAFDRPWHFRDSMVRGAF